MDILLAWVASIVTGLEAVVIKMASKSLVRSPWLFNVLWLGFAVPPIVVLAVTQGGGLPSEWPPILFTSLSSAGFYVLYTLAVYRLDITTITPLFSIRTITSVLLGLILLGESLPALGIVLMVLIVGASPLASYDEKQRLRAFLQRHVFLAIVAMTSLAFMGYFANQSVAANGYATTVLWQDLLTLVLLCPTLKFVQLKAERFTKKSLVAFGFLGFASFVYTATTTYAYAHKLSLSSIIVSLPFSMIFAWLLSFRYPELLEKHSPRVYAVRFAGAAVMVGGAIWLSLL